jgi:hypothetical protein
MNEGEVVIRTPCGADFDAMDPRGTARFCASCKKLVHDLSALGEVKARALLRSTPESLCVRYLHDETGKLWFGEPTPTLIAKDQLTRGKRMMAAAALVVTPILFQACGGADPYDDRERSSDTDAGAEPPEPDQQGITKDDPAPGTTANDDGADAEAEAESGETEGANDGPADLDPLDPHEQGDGGTGEPPERGRTDDGSGRPD